MLSARIYRLLSPLPEQNERVAEKTKRSTETMERLKNELWARQDLNLQPTDYESVALTIELRAQEIGQLQTS